MIQMVAVGIPYRRGSSKSSWEVWGQLRCESGPLDGLWEFPGGKIEPTEKPLEALVREVREETGEVVDAKQLQLFTIKPHCYVDRQVVLYFYLVAGLLNLPQKGWHDLQTWMQKPMLDANIPVLKDLQNYLKGRIDGTH